MPATIERFTITRFQYPRSRPIGDSQVISHDHYSAALELHDSAGHTGTGFFGALFHPLPPLTELERSFAEEAFPGVQGQDPFSLLNRIGRPRGGNRRGTIFGTAVNQALWDLQGQALGLPLYRLLGGTRDRVRAYASGLDYHMPDDQFHAFFREARARGFGAFKIKVGHPDLGWDLHRLSLLVDAVGRDGIIMVDANEAWTPKEAIRRAHAYHAAGYTPYWLEDPTLRDDFAGLAQISQAVPFSHVNSGEYLDLQGKSQLLAAGGADILNIHGHISDSLQAGRLAAHHGIRVSLGNTAHEIGVHLACALPEADWLEYSFLDYDHLIANPIQFADGYALAPDRPGHGLALSDTARSAWSRPEA
jgi:L-alanine-DL-glutamate epimerase-like enolase superfamily enzyme